MIVLGTLIYPSIPSSVIVFLWVMYLSFSIEISFVSFKRKRLIVILMLTLSVLFLIWKSILVYLLYKQKMFNYKRILWVSFGITINTFEIDLEKWIKTFGPDIITAFISFYLIIYIKGKIKTMRDNHENLRIINEKVGPK